MIRQNYVSIFFLQTVSTMAAAILFELLEPSVAEYLI